MFLAATFFQGSSVLPNRSVVDFVWESYTTNNLHHLGAEVCWSTPWTPFLRQPVQAEVLHITHSQRSLQTGQHNSGCISLASLPSLDSSLNPSMPSHLAHIHHPQVHVVKSHLVPPVWHQRSSKTPSSGLRSEEIQTLINTEIRIHLCSGKEAA